MENPNAKGVTLVPGTRVLVTGASGFIGRHVCRRLSQDDVEVHGVYRSHQPEEMGSTRWWCADLSDLEAVRGLWKSVQPDLVLHLASHVAGSRDLELVLPTVRDNFLTSVNLLVASAESGIQRMVLVGSMEEPGRDAGEPAPCSPYAAAKWATSAYARMFRELYDLPVVIARVFMVYGPGQRDLKKLVPYVILSLLNKETPKLSSGRREVDWVYVEDVVDALVKIMRVPDLDGATVEIGSGEFVSVGWVAKEIARIIGFDTPLAFGAVPDRLLEKVIIADAEQTYSQIGWRASTPISEGLRRTVEWYAGRYDEGPGSFSSGN